MQSINLSLDDHLYDEMSQGLTKSLTAEKWVGMLLLMRLWMKILSQF